MNAKAENKVQTQEWVNSGGNSDAGDHKVETGTNEAFYIF